MSLEIEYTSGGVSRPPEWSRIGKGKELLDVLIEQGLYIPGITPARQYNLTTARDHVKRTPDAEEHLRKQLAQRRAQRLQQVH